LWIAPWGWTWVDSAPWGYAPFHYGRWTYLNGRWGWVPAAPRGRAVYAPALVAWVGGPGGGKAATAGIAPGAGWLPLAPGEVYLPGHRVSARYLHDVNTSNTIIGSSSTITSVYQNPGLQNRYANQSAPRALTALSPANFASGQSLAGRTPQAAVRHPPLAIANRPVIARHTPPPVPGLRPRIVLAPQLRAPLTPAPPRPAPMPDRHVMPVTPVDSTPAAEPSPAERRMIPERSPQYQPQVPARSQVQQQSPPPRQVEAPVPSPPPLPRQAVPAPPSPPPPPNAKPSPQVQRPEIRKGEPN
jgi:hypothetical protein